MAATKDDLSTLLGGLSLKEKGKKQLSGSSLALQREIDRAGFRIFECLSDHGYFSWNQPRGSSYKSLGDITNPDDFKVHLDLDGKPDTLVKPSSISVPKAFRSVPADEHENKFPYGQQDAVSLHVASCHRGIDFSQVDFAFGGSTLEMLANCDASDPYMVTLIPGTKTIFVVKNKEYVADLSQPGFQFERLMTGKSMAGRDTDVISSSDHLQLLNVSEYKVFFHAETDAVDDGGYPVEIKASNPRYWGTKVMFQMISSGSTKLCHGFKSRGSLVKVSLQSLGEVANTALSAHSIESLEGNIVKGMESLRNQMETASPGEVFKVSFLGNSLKLSTVQDRSSNILPPEDVMMKLLT